MLKTQNQNANVCVGENGHLAFNDPPADFDTEEPYIIVELDDACRRQQLSEGCLKVLMGSLKGHLSMSIKQIIKSKNIICTVPDSRKAQTIKNCLENDISPDYPASILRSQESVFYF